MRWLTIPGDPPGSRGVQPDRIVEILPEENVAIIAALWFADMALHPDLYRADAVEFVHHELQERVSAIHALRLKFGLERIPPK